MNFFQYQALTPYTFVGESGTSYTLSITNLTQHAVLRARLQQVLQVLYDYSVQDGERPDTVATKVYGDPKYTWLVLMLNNIFSLYDWPLTNDEFAQYMAAKYGTLALSQAVTTDEFYYFNADGVQVTSTAYAALDAVDRGSVLPARYCFTSTGERIDATSYDALAAALQGGSMTPYDYENTQNETKRRIKVISTEFLPAIDRELKTLYR